MTQKLYNIPEGKPLTPCGHDNYRCRHGCVLNDANNSSGGEDSIGIGKNKDGARKDLATISNPMPSKPEHLICQKCQNKVCMCMCEKVVWTDELLADACEKMVNDAYLPDIDGGRMQPCLPNQLNDLAKALRERAKEREG